MYYINIYIYICIYTYVSIYIERKDAAKSIKALFDITE